MLAYRQIPLPPIYDIELIAFSVQSTNTSTNTIRTYLANTQNNFARQSHKNTQTKRRHRHTTLQTHKHKKGVSVYAGVALDNNSDNSDRQSCRVPRPLVAAAFNKAPNDVYVFRSAVPR